LLIERSRCRAGRESSIGDVRLGVHVEIEPCERMDEAAEDCA
jgi:hypothetical protein